MVKGRTGEGKKYRGIAPAN